jgi:dTDP-4-amino-4,6-dideoxygalactose transaminase
VIVLPVIVADEPELSTTIPPFCKSVNVLFVIVAVPVVLKSANRPTRTPNDGEYIQQALAGGHLSGDGPFTMRCHEILQQVVGVPRAFLTTSCTHALEMAAFLIDINPGDEVIVPSFTFVSSVNAFVIRGAQPVFADIRPTSVRLLFTNCS